MIAVLVGGTLLASCAAPQPPPSMVVIVIDTLRADHLGIYGYRANPTSPRLDARAPAAAVFERAFSTAPWTLPAFGSLFTGHIPTRHAAGVRVDAATETGADDRIVTRPNKTLYRLDDRLPTLAATLRAAGYRTAAIMNNSFLSPEFGLDRGFDSYDFDPKAPERIAADATDRALAWLRSHEVSDSGAPFLLFVHYFDPHMPYQAPPPWLGRFAARHEGNGFRAPVTEWRWMRHLIRERDDGWQELAALERALYDEEIAYTDAEVDRLLGTLDERGFLDTGYVLLTSDHGEEFHDHGGVEHGHTVYDEVIRVPLFLWGPEIRPGRYPLPTSLIDVMPTLLDIAGVQAPDDLPGVSLLPALREGAASRTESLIRFDRPLLAERTLYGDEKKALTRWPWKAWVDVVDEGQWLFNLDTDPEEQSGSALEELDDIGRDRLLSMLAELQTMIASASAQAGGEEASLSEATLERLRALGYIR